jgi:hypothetical protein
MYWRDVHVGERNSRFRLQGIDVWREEWRWMDAKTIELPNPLDERQRCRYQICEVGDPRRPVRFAVGELPGGLWSFYVPE